MEPWRYGVLITVIFLVTAVPAMIGMYWLLYIYPYDKNETCEETNAEEPEWTDNPIHIEATAL